MNGGRTAMAWLCMAFGALCLCAGCVELADFEHCREGPSEPVVIEGPVTYHQEIRPILEGRCVRCHQEGGIGPFPLTTYEEAQAWRRPIRVATRSGSMPPWLAAGCCNHFQHDFSLTAQQVALIEAWVEGGAEEGDPSAPGAALEPVGGLSRVDVEVRMPEPYTPEPAAGRVDDFRCFILDWPLKEPVYITGFNPVPGAREVLHHLVIAAATGADAEALEDRPPAEDDQPGFPCEGGLGDLPTTSVLGGSLLGSDYPEGLGQRIEGGAKLILAMHYSMADAEARADQTTLQFRTAPLEPALQEMASIPIANPAWLIGDAMRIPAGERGVRYAYQFEPSLFTRGEPVLLWAATPHLHALGESVIIGVVREDGAKDCLLDIPDWDFGWEQPFWFAEPIRLDPGDEVHIECTFDNTATNQPVVNGTPLPPRDVAWGTDYQDMCVGFLTFTRLEGGAP